MFVAGASGAIGTLVVQMASRRGVRVIGSASAANHDYLLSLGAEAAVDYHDDDWPAQIREWSTGGVDAALAIQPGIDVGAQEVVRNSGRVVTVSGYGESAVTQRGIRVEQVEQVEHRGDGAGADMSQLVDDITSGLVRLVLERIYPFEEAISAPEKTETRHARGKLVVTDPTPA
ncbi:MAG: zinc-binding dehydrogenase [Ilumatobacteraceae bacterium]